MCWFVCGVPSDVPVSNIVHSVEQLDVKRFGRLYHTLQRRRQCIVYKPRGLRDGAFVTYIVRKVYTRL